MFIEETFGVTLEAHEADKEHLNTINQIADLISARKS